MIRRCPAGPHLPVGLHVLLAVERGLKRLLAVGAHVGAEVVVDAHVSPQAAPGRESAVTDQTLERLQACVRSHVRFEHSCGNKASSTLRTLKGLFTCMGPEKKKKQQWMSTLRFHGALYFRMHSHNYRTWPPPTFLIPMGPLSLCAQVTHLKSWHKTRPHVLVHVSSSPRDPSQSLLWPGFYFLLTVALQ